MDHPRRKKQKQLLVKLGVNQSVVVLARNEQLK